MKQKVTVKVNDSIEIELPFNTDLYGALKIYEKNNKGNKEKSDGE